DRWGGVVSVLVVVGCGVVLLFIALLVPIGGVAVFSSVYYYILIGGYYTRPTATAATTRIMSTTLASPMASPMASPLDNQDDDDEDDDRRDGHGDGHDKHEQQEDGADDKQQQQQEGEGEGPITTGGEGIMQSAVVILSDHRLRTSHHHHDLHKQDGESNNINQGHEQKEISSFPSTSSVLVLASAQSDHDATSMLPERQPPSSVASSLDYSWSYLHP
ncbi:hypothetical protein FOZ63_016115, partial [Perkinsus olseni]